MIPGVKPASAAPSSRRMTYSWLALWIKLMPAAMMPQVIMIRAIQRRAPTLVRIRLLGTSNRM
ncbi:hypothetical protein D3C85_1216170 [compost metagenome]